jgi:hypothetical protein
MFLMLNILILVGLPFGTALLFGALSEKLAGPVISGWLSVAGMFVGVYLLHKVFEWTLVGQIGSHYGS